MSAMLLGRLAWIGFSGALQDLRTSCRGDPKPKRLESVQPWRDRGDDSGALCLKQEPKGSNVADATCSRHSTGQSVIQDGNGVGGLQAQGEDLRLSRPKVDDEV